MTAPPRPSSSRALSALIAASAFSAAAVVAAANPAHAQSRIASAPHDIQVLSPSDPFPPLGGGLNGQPAYSLDYAFADAMVNAGPFRNLSYTVLNLPPDAFPAQDFVFYVQENTPAQAGVYKIVLVARQQPTISREFAAGTISNIVWTPNTHTLNGQSYGTLRADWTVPTGGNTMVLSVKNAGNSGGQSGVAALHVYRPGVDPTNPGLYSPAYLNFLLARKPAALRFMDYHDTNGNTEVSWSERTKPTDPTQNTSLTRIFRTESSDPLGTDQSFTGGRGISWEYAVGLCNALNCDLWVNVPVGADDDYVRSLAQLIRDGSTLVDSLGVARSYPGLKPGLKVYVEYSNEVWNDGFMQTKVNRQAAVNEVVAQNGTANPSDLNYDNISVTVSGGHYQGWVTWGDRRVARRIKQISDIFTQEFGAGSLGTRVRPVFAYQVGNVSRYKDPLRYLNAVYGPPSNYLWAVAGAPYFACGNGQGADARTNLTPTQVLNELKKDVDAWRDNGALNDLATLASFYNLKVVAYEGGPDTFGGNNIAAKKAASLDPRMKDVVKQYLDTWYSKGNDLFLWFVLGAGGYDSQYGTWSISTDINELNQPKSQGYDLVRDSPRAPLAIGNPIPSEVDARAVNGNPASTTSAGYWQRFIGPGTTFDYLFKAPAAGQYTVSVSAGDRTGGPNDLEVIVNNGAPQTVAVPATTGSNMIDTAPVTVSLREGLNTIRLRVPTNRPYSINSLRVTPVGGAGVANRLPDSTFYEFVPSRNANQVYTNNFTVRDAETPAASVVATATSDNPALIPPSGIQVTSGSGGARTLTITPAADKNGTANISVSVTDGAGQTRTSGFRLTVNPRAADTAPDFSVGTANATVNLTPNAIATNGITFGTTQNFASLVSLSVTGLPKGVDATFAPANAPVTTGSTITLTAEPTAETGTFTITVTGRGTANQNGSNVNLTRTATFTLNVGAPTPPSALPFTFSRSGLIYNSVTQTFNGTLTLTYTGQTPLNGPLFAVLTGLPTGVTLANAAGTYNGSPYLTADANNLTAGQSIKLTVRFSNPNRVLLNYGVSVYPGTP